MARAKVLVLGVGNTIMGDDGVGYCFARALAECGGGEGVDVEAIPALELGALGLLEERSLVVVVDACVVPEGKPGEVYVAEASGVEENGVPLHSHDTDPLKLLALARSLGVTRGRAVVVCVVPYRIEAGLGVTSEVMGSLARVYHEVARLVEKAGGRLRASLDCVIGWVRERCSSPLLD